MQIISLLKYDSCIFVIKERKKKKEEEEEKEEENNLNRFASLHRIK